MRSLGIVTIGRNEGDRLQQCLRSVIDHAAQVIYVDSGSTDGSVELARSLGVTVVELDLSIPFTAARARNAGLTRLLEIAPDLDYVQFIDGDCEVVEGWLAQAQHVLNTQSDVVVVCGRRRERYPAASIYNRLCDLEWNTPVGEAKACGGDAMMRISALQVVGGYNPNLIAGEEPELCVRLRQNGGRILRIDAEMTLHDAQMTRFGQWWKRSVRAGYAYTEGAWLHGSPPERHWVKESRSIRLWGLITPALLLATAIPTHGWSVWLLAGYPLMAYRAYRFAWKSGQTRSEALLFGLSCTLAKFPQAQGQMRFYWGKLFKQPSRLIEYNTPTSKSSEPAVDF